MFIKGAEIVLVPERRKGGFGATSKGGVNLLLSERDADLLRMTCWCQYLSPSDAQSISSKEETEDLVRLGLLKIHKSSGAYVLTGKGVQLLQYMLDGQLPVIRQSYHSEAIERRLRRASLALTAYRAGMNIFSTSMAQLHNENTLFFTAYGRGRGQNPWGSTRIVAVAHMAGTVYAVHYLYPEIGPLTLTDELSAFYNNTAHLGNAKPAFLFAGDSYGGILEELRRESEPKKLSKKVPYKTACRTLQHPIHFLSCDDVGAMQLKIMSIPHYRLKLTKAALASHYRPPPEKMDTWDAIYNGSPLILAVDMDLRRVSAGISSARENGYPDTVLLVLQEQAAVMRSLYAEDRFVSIYCLTDSALRHFADGPLELHRPKPTQYLTEKGGVIDTPLIQSYRKAGR